MPKVLFRIPFGPNGLAVHSFGVLCFLVLLILIGLGWLLARKAGMKSDTYLDVWAGIFTTMLVVIRILWRA